MKRKVMALSAVGVIVLGIIYISWPVGHIPPYDANLVRLAETELQGYCAGDAFWKSGGNGDGNLAAECRQKRVKQFSGKINLRAVQPAFCQAIVDNGWDGTKNDCLTIMADNEYWPTYNGAITNAWNRARKYPLTFGASTAGSNQGSGSRTGGSHGDQTHGGGTRDSNPSYPYP